MIDRKIGVIVMKFNTKERITLCFYLAVFGSGFAMPVMANAIADNEKLVEKNSEVDFSEKVTERATTSPSAIRDESTLSKQDRYSEVRSVDKKSSLSINHRNLQTNGEIDDHPLMIPQEVSLGEPVELAETIPISSNTNNRIASISAMPKLGKASQLAQVTIAQNDETLGFRATRGGPSYLGVGGSFGSRADFAIFSKIGLNNSFSLRPSVLLLNNFATVLIPFTYDFAPQSFLTPDLILAPYLGGGIGFRTGTDSTIGGLITAGVDIPISRTFTVNVAANLTFFNQTDLGILLGIAYNF
jgi:hypothetical protein